MLCPSVGCSMVEVQCLLALDSTRLTSNPPLYGFKNPRLMSNSYRDETEVAMISSQVKSRRQACFDFHVQVVDTTPFGSFGV